MYTSSESYFLPNMTDEELANLNTSEHDFPNEIWYVKSPKEIAIKTSMMIPVGVIGIFLNYIILLILYKNKWLWSPNNILVGNLAFVDLVTLLLCPWLMLVRDLHQNFVLGVFGCRFEGFLQSACLLAAVGAVMLVSYDRLAAAATLTTEARITKKTAPRLIFLSWFIAALLSTPWIIFRRFQRRQWKNFLETFCIESDFLGVYWHVVITVLVWVPLGLMILTYTVILWRLRESSRDLTSRGGGASIVKGRARAVKITACVLIATTICRLPYTVLVYWRNDIIRRAQINAVNGAYDIFWFVATYLIYLDCALNPLIYGFTNERFKRAMDRTPGAACFKFGTWCCVCSVCIRKPKATSEKNEKIFVIENSPKPNKKLTRVIKHILHINKDTMELSLPNELTYKPTKATPLKTENI